MPAHVDAPGVVLKYRDKRPYIEVWNGDKLLLAGWVYDAPDYLAPRPDGIPGKTGDLFTCEPWHGKATTYLLSTPLDPWTE
jgi:hypothetical protein